MRCFASWLTAGGEIPGDPFPGVKAHHASNGHSSSCSPTTSYAPSSPRAWCLTTPAAAEATLHHRSDEAIIRLMFETAIRSGELSDEVDDVDLTGRLITIRRGKGGRDRVIPIG